MNYSLKDLMINCGNEDIQGLIYYFSKESKTKDSDTYDDTANEQKIDEQVQYIIKKNNNIILEQNETIECNRIIKFLIKYSANKK